MLCAEELYNVKSPTHTHTPTTAYSVTADVVPTVGSINTPDLRFCHQGAPPGAQLVTSQTD